MSVLSTPFWAQIQTTAPYKLTQINSIPVQIRTAQKWFLVIKVWVMTVEKASLPSFKYELYKKGVIGVTVCGQYNTSNIVLSFQLINTW